MRIKAIHIDEYGIYRDFQLELEDENSPLTIVYGANEAGKSTLHAFLRASLFGFQMKGAAHYLGDAKGGIGGRMSLEDREGHTYVLERKTPPKNGKIRVFAEDGRELSPNTLEQLLGHVSAPLFTNLFAFSHQELQRLETLQGDEVSAYLYSAALGQGASQLVEVEQRMIKLSDALFRPRATNPPLNQLIKEVEESQLQIETMQRKLAAYPTVKQRLREAQEKLHSLRAQRERVMANQHLYAQIAKLLELEDALADVSAKLNSVKSSFTSLGELHSESRLRLDHEEKRWGKIIRKSKKHKRLTFLYLALTCFLPIISYLLFEQPTISILLFLGLLWLTRGEYIKWTKGRLKERKHAQFIHQLREEMRTMEKEKAEQVRRLEAEQKQLLQQRDALFQTLNQEQSGEVELHLSGWNKELVAQKRESLDQQYEQILEDIESLARTSGQLEAELEALEGEEGLSLLHQELEERKAQLEQKAKSWATYSLAAYLCQEVRRVYEEEHQPNVLKDASYFFNKMTLGRYKQIIIPFGEKKLQVIRGDNRRLDVEQLSQGTVEQLYLAMRFAVVKDYERVANLPIFLDDIFINFDQERAKAALSCLSELAFEHQIIYFTCHEHMLTLGREVMGQVHVIDLAAAKRNAHNKGIMV